MSEVLHPIDASVQLAHAGLMHDHCNNGAMADRCSDACLD